MFNAVEIKNDIYWVGAVDFASYDFHGYSVSPQGTTYNSYVLLDEKNVLFDNVKKEFLDVFLERLRKVIEPSKIDYIIINHAELDHAGVLKEVVELCKPEKIFCSKMCKQSLEAHFDTTGWPIQTVKTGDIINVGKRNIKFYEARMLHWPDSMFSYIVEEKFLITNDAFGQNIATTQRFADEVDKSLVSFVMSEYYHNIVLPFSPRVEAVIKMLQNDNIGIDYIAPDHGLIFRGKDEVNFAINSYLDFAKQKTQLKALILYDTMWNSTEKMAYAMAEGIGSLDIPTRVMNLKQYHHSSIMTELAHCGIVAVGSPTHNNNVLPAVAGVLTYMRGLKPKNRIGAAFGSYGWSGEAVDVIKNFMDEMNLDMPLPPKKTIFVPTEDVLKKEYYDMGVKLGEALIEKINASKESGILRETSV